MIYTFDALKLDEEKIIELIERAKYIRNIFYNIYEKNNAKGEYFPIDMRYNKSTTLYKKHFKEELNLVERTIIFVYFVIPNDEKFLNDFLIYKGNFATIGKNYGVSKEFALLRWMIQRKVSKYNKSVKKLTLKEE